MRIYDDKLVSFAMLPSVSYLRSSFQLKITVVLICGLLVFLACNIFVEEICMLGKTGWSSIPLRWSHTSCASQHGYHPRTHRKAWCKGIYNRNRD